MVKSERFLFFRIFATVFIIFFINAGSFIYKYNIKMNGITGHSIKSGAVELYTSMPASSRIFLIVQWGLLIFILLYASFRDKGTAKRKKELVGIDIKKIRKGSKTDLDVLYEVLKNKKELSIEGIAKTFKINKKLALEWAKILESGRLAYIDYPRFGGVSLKLKEAKKTKEEQEKEGKKIKQKTKPKNKTKKINIKLDRKTKRELKKLNKKTKKTKKKLNKKIKVPEIKLKRNKTRKKK